MASYLLPEEFEILIGSVDYSTSIDSFDVSGGTPVREFIPVWSGRKKTVITGYNEWVISFDMLVGSDTVAFIDGLDNTFTTTYSFSVGSDGLVQRTYNNFYFQDASESMVADNGLQIVKLSFVAEGLNTNRV